MKLKILLLILILFFSTKSYADYNTLEENDDIELVITKTNDLIIDINYVYTNIIINHLEKPNSITSYVLNKTNYFYNNLLNRFIIFNTKKEIIVFNKKSKYIALNKILNTNKNSKLIYNYLIKEIFVVNLCNGRSP